MIFPESLSKEDFIVKELTRLGKIEILSEKDFNSILGKLFRSPVSWNFVDCYFLIYFV